MPRHARVLGALAVVACLAAAGAAWCAEAQETEADLQFRYAESLFRDGLRKQAIPELEKFLQAHPKDPRASTAHFYLGECRRLGEDYKGALAAYEQAVADKTLPQRTVALYRLGECRFRLGDTRGAIAPLREFLAAELAAPERQRYVVHATYALARAELAEGHHDVALVLLQQVLADKSPENTYKPTVLLPIGDCLAALGRPAEALAHYQKLEAHLQAALEEAPEGSQADKRRSVLQNLRLKMANIHLGQKQYAEALAVFQRLPEEGSVAEEVVYGRAQALFFLQRYAEALGPAQAYLKRFPKGALRPSALPIAPEAQYRTDHFAEAERLFAQFLASEQAAKHPARQTASYGRVAAAYRQGKDHARAIAEAAEAFLKDFPKSQRVADVHYFRAEAAFWLGHHEAALEHYQKVPSDGPYAQEVAHQAAVCLDLLGRTRDAALAYDVYLQRYPKGEHHRQALERSARLWGQLKDYTRAAERYGAFVAQYAKAAPKVAEEFLYRKGACEYEAKHYDAMYRTFTSYFDQHPGGEHKHSVLYFLAWYHDEHKEQPEAAARLYELCAQIDGPYQTQARVHLAHACHRIGKARQAAGQGEEADAFFLKAAQGFLALMRDAPDALTGPSEYLWTAEVLRKLGRKAEALEAYERLLARFPDQATPLVLYRLGELARSLDTPDLARAEKYLTQFLEKFSKHELTLWATFSLAETLRANPKSPQHAKAAEHYRTVVALAPQKLTDPQARESLVLRCQLQLGRIAYEAERWDEAGEALRRVGYLATGEEAAEALYKAGHALRHQDSLRPAIAIWQRLLRLHGKSAWAQRLAKALPPLGLQVAEDGETIVKTPRDASPKAAPEKS